MKLLKWEESISVNDELIDKQHQELYKIVNKLIANCNVNFDYAIAKNIIEELKAYSFYHFNDEEEMLEERQYPFIDKHIEEHNGFRIKINDISSRFNKNKDKETIRELLTYVVEWVTNHTNEFDLDYKKYLNSDSYFSEQTKP